MVDQSADAKAAPWADPMAVWTAARTAESLGMHWADCWAVAKAENLVVQLENWRAEPSADAMAVDWADLRGD